MTRPPRRRPASMADLHRAASRSTVPSEAFDFTHPDHEEWVGADNDRCLAPDCALHHEQAGASEVQEAAQAKDGA